MPTTVLTDQTLQRFVDNNPVVVIRFHAKWCGPCRMFAPVFSSVANSFPAVPFAEVDVDEQPVASRYFQVQALPTTVLVKDGKIVDKMSGAKDSSSFSNWLSKHVKQQQSQR